MLQVQQLFIIFFNSLDGTRVDGVFYFSPKFNGFQGKLSTTEGGDIDAAVSYEGRLSSFKVAGIFGYKRNNDGAPSKTNLNTILVGSGSILHDSGIGFTFSLGKEGRESGAELSYYYTKVGYTWDSYSIAADYTSSDTGDALNTKGTAVSLGAQYEMGHGVSVAAVYRNVAIEKDARDYDDLNFLIASFRIKSLGLNTSDFKTVFLLLEKPLSIAFHKDTDDKIINELQKRLDDLKTSGEYKKIVSKYK